MTANMLGWASLIVVLMLLAAAFIGDQVYRGRGVEAMDRPLWIALLWTAAFVIAGVDIAFNVIK